MNIRLLRANEIDVRVGGFNKEKTGGFLLLYKDARVDMNILDETFGIFGWKRKHEVVNGNLYCTISIYNPTTKEWIDKQDVGVESNESKEKGEASDSFKRAAFNVGIGRELYTPIFIWINGLDKYDKFKVKEISYNENREIIQLVITDNRGNEKFRMGGQNKALSSALSGTRAKYDVEANSNSNKQSKSPGGPFKLSDKQIIRMYTIAKTKNYTKEEVLVHIKAKYGKTPEEMNKKEYETMCTGYENMKLKEMEDQKK